MCGVRPPTQKKPVWQKKFLDEESGYYTLTIGGYKKSTGAHCYDSVTKLASTAKKIFLKKFKVKIRFIIFSFN